MGTNCVSNLHCEHLFVTDGPDVSMSRSMSAAQQSTAHVWHEYCSPFKQHPETESSCSLRQMYPLSSAMCDRPCTVFAQVARGMSLRCRSPRCSLAQRFPQGQGHPRRAFLYLTDSAVILTWPIAGARLIAQLGPPAPAAELPLPVTPPASDTRITGLLQRSVSAHVPSTPG